VRTRDMEPGSGGFRGVAPPGQHVGFRGAACRPGQQSARLLEDVQRAD
jgi:hypothetical protein